MKPIVQKLPLSEDTSFIARTYKTPNFEVPWHQHIEYELILFTEGEGLSFVGNYVGEFETDDVFFLGSNIPHTFQKRHRDLITSAVVVQFTEDFWGSDFLQLPENRALHHLFQSSMQGIKTSLATRKALKRLIIDLETERGLQRLLLLFRCLQLLTEDKSPSYLSTQEAKQFNNKDKQRIDKVFQYTIDNFKSPITLEAVADIAGMTVPAFCSYFKKSTKKTYINFLNEVRVGNTCQLLIDTNMSILEICYESGFNTVANFNKQFLKVKKLTPSRYRADFKNR